MFFFFLAFFFSSKTRTNTQTHTPVAVLGGIYDKAYLHKVSTSEKQVEGKHREQALLEKCAPAYVNTPLEKK